jgi:hypothetical protein
MALAKQMHVELRSDPKRIPDSGRALADFKPSALVDPSEDASLTAGARTEQLDGHRYLFYAGLAVLTEVFGRNFQDPSVSLVTVDRHLESRLKSQPRPIGRFQEMAKVTTKRGKNTVDKMLDAFPDYDGYSFVVDRVTEYLPAFQQLRPHERYRDLPTLFEAGINSSVWAATNFAEVYARALFVNGHFTNPEKKQPSLREMRAGVVRSTFLRDLAALRSTTFSDALGLLAGCNDGCQKQDAQGRVSDGVDRPSHPARSWHNPYTELEYFKSGHRSEASSLHTWFEISQSVDGLLVPEAPGLFAEAKLREAARLAANPNQWDQLGCPALFHGMARKIGETIANMATHEMLWPNEVKAMRSGKDLDWGTVYI